MVFFLFLLFGAQPLMASQKTRLQFAWPDQGRVTVDQRGTKGDKPTNLSFEITWKTEKSYKVVTIESLKILDIKGRDLSDPEIQAAVKPLQGELINFPKIMVDELGRFVTVDDLKGHPASKQKAMTDHRLISRISRDWNHWVGLWTYVQFGDGRAEFHTPLSSDIIGDFDPMIELSYLGTEACGTMKCPKLRFQSVVRGKNQKKGDLVMRKIRERLGGKGIDAIIENVIITTQVTIITDPGTLRPFHVGSEKTVTATINGKVMNQNERKSYRFYW